jgi:hypothetical protein
MLLTSRSRKGPRRYARYNAELTLEGLRALECTDIDPDEVQKLDSIAAIPQLARIGKSVAERRVAREHFNFDIFQP